MRSRPGFRRVGLVALIVAALAGCAGQKAYEAPTAAPVSSRPCDTAVEAMEALRVTADQSNAQGKPAQPGEQALLLPAEALRLRHVVRREGTRCYELRLAAIRAIETTNRQKAMEDYASLKSFVGSLRRLDVVFPAIDFDAKIAELKQIETDAQTAYAAAEVALQDRKYPEAIALYRRALDLVPDYEMAKQKLAECYYQMGLDAVGNRNYREATQFFQKADQQQPNYRDTRSQAARIHGALGDYFMAQGYPRNAVLEYGAVESVLPGSPGIREKLEAARTAARERIAVAGISNRSGKSIEGVAMEEFLANSLLERLQKKGRFTEVYPPTRLEGAGVGLALKDPLDQSRAADLAKLRGVRYLVTGEITEISQKWGAPVRVRREASARTPEGGMATTDREGSPRPSFDETTWSVEITVAGRLEVLDAQTGKIVVRQAFDRLESAGGRWAENPSLPETRKQPSPDVQSLVLTSSPWAVAKRALGFLADELVSAILTKVDDVPSVPNPTDSLAELNEPKIPVVLTRPPVQVETVEQDTSKAESTLRQQRIKVKGDAVNIRLKPTTESQSLGRSKRGDVFPLVSRQNGWVKIRLGDGREGWIAERLVELLLE